VSSARVTTLAGRQGVESPFSDGIGTMATFYFPYGIALDSAGSIALVVRLITDNDSSC
jgi:hypothetical protein